MQKHRISQRQHGDAGAADGHAQGENTCPHHGLSLIHICDGIAGIVELEREARHGEKEVEQKHAEK